MDVSIIIVNYKTADLVTACIASVVEHTKEVSYEIIVVDNNSEDNIGNRLKELYKDDVKFVGLDENIGFGRANNKGFEIATGRYLFCLNPDTVLLNNAVKILSNFLDEHHDVGVCGGNLYDENMQPTLSFSRMLPSIKWELNILFFNKIEKFLYGKNIQFNHTGKPLNVGYITGADLMIKKSIINDIQGFSNDFFMYYEETDLCCRIKKKGYLITSVPNAKIQHLEGKSLKGKESVKAINTKGIAFSEKSRLTYYRRNTKPTTFKLINLIYKTALTTNKFVFKTLGNRVWEEYDYKLKLIDSLL